LQLLLGLCQAGRVAGYEMNSNSALKEELSGGFAHA
jgi:hypothetical protein